MNNLNELYTPPIIHSFIESLLDRSKVIFKNCLIYDVYSPDEVFFFSKKDKSFEKLYFIGEYSHSMRATIIHLDGDSSSIDTKNWTEIKLGYKEPLKVLDNVSDKLDLIIARPPMGVITPIGLINGFIIAGDLEEQFLIQSSRLLSKGGLGIFIMPQNFFTTRGDSPAKGLLSIVGLKIDAAFELPKNTFYPHSSILANVVIVKRGRSDKLFIGTIQSSASHQEILLNNYLDMREGKSVSLGRYIELDDFFTVSKEIKRAEVKERINRQDFPIIELKEICKEINVLTKNNIEKNKTKANSVFLPKIGVSKAVNVFEDATIKPNNLIQLVLDENKADAQYVAKFFNSELGVRLREYLSAASFIPAFNKYQLPTLSIPLPDIKHQQNIISFNFEIDSSINKLEGLIKKVWGTPKLVNMHKKALNNIIKKEKGNEWIETLPFPLSSILRGFYSTTNPQRQFDFIMFFFEALAEFLVVIKLSGLSSDSEFYKKIKNKLFKKSDKFSTWYKRADFGGWINTSLKLSKVLKELIDDQNNKQIVNEIFGFPSDEFLNLIVDRKYDNILLEVGRYRNKWKGHGGIADDNEYRNRIELLNRFLIQFKEPLIQAFEDFKLILPMNMTLSEGIFSVHVQEITGSNTKFNENYIESSIGLDNNNLYFTFLNSISPVKLIPLIKIAPSPKTAMNACYFYNRLEPGGKARLVSYHFEIDSEITEDDEIIMKALSLLDYQIE